MNERHLLCHETGLVLLLRLERDLEVPFLPPGFDDRADADYSGTSLGLAPLLLIVSSRALISVSTPRIGIYDRFSVMLL